MGQAFLPPEHLTNDRFRIIGDEARHLLRVLRVRVGDTIDLFDGAGRTATGCVRAVDPDAGHLSGDVLSLRVTPPHPSGDVTLFQGLPRGGKSDWLIEKATELGADRIVFFTSEKNPLSPGSDGAAARLTRWERVALAAAKQCGRATIPAFSPPAPLPALRDRFTTGRTIVFLPDAATPARAAFEALPPGADVGLLIGPESGFTPAEAAWLATCGTPASLGPRVLRTETAGIAALAALDVLRHHHQP